MVFLLFKAQSTRRELQGHQNEVLENNGNSELFNLLI